MIRKTYYVIGAGLFFGNLEAAYAKSMNYACKGISSNENVNYIYSTLVYQYASVIIAILSIPQ